MSYIKKESLCAWLKNMGISDFIIQRIKSEIFFPTLNVAEIKHGKWKLYSDGSGICSVCGRHQKHIWDMDHWQNFCGHCGADLREEK